MCTRKIGPKCEEATVPYTGSPSGAFLFLFMPRGVHRFHFILEAHLLVRRPSPRAADGGVALSKASCWEGPAGVTPRPSPQLVRHTGRKPGSSLYEAPSAGSAHPNPTWTPPGITWYVHFSLPCCGTCIATTQFQRSSRSSNQPARDKTRWVSAGCSLHAICVGQSVLGGIKRQCSLERKNGGVDAGLETTAVLWASAPPNHRHHANSLL